MANWKNLVIALLLEDDCIDEKETALIKAQIMDDGVVDEEEIQFLIGLRKSARKTCEQFEEFFFEVLEQYLLKDDMIDAVETELIRSVIYADGKIDASEIKFLRKLASKAHKTDHRFKALCQECQVDI